MLLTSEATYKCIILCIISSVWQNVLLIILSIKEFWLKKCLSVNIIKPYITGIFYRLENQLFVQLKC